jgi:hypothetical protein
VKSESGEVSAIFVKLEMSPSTLDSRSRGVIDNAFPANLFVEQFLVSWTSRHHGHHAITTRSSTHAFQILPPRGAKSF